MWPFGHRTALPETEPSVSDRLIRRVEELEETNRKIEKALRDLELDWSEWFNKFRLLYARLTKRVKDEERRETESQEPPEATISPAGNHHDPRAELIHQRLSRPKGPSRNY